MTKWLVIWPKWRQHLASLGSLERHNFHVCGNFESNVWWKLFGMKRPKTSPIQTHRENEIQYTHWVMFGFRWIQKSSKKVTVGQSRSVRPPNDYPLWLVHVPDKCTFFCTFSLMAPPLLYPRLCAISTTRHNLCATNHRKENRFCSSASQGSTQAAS